MADDWKILGREVPAGLLRIATSEQALASLDEALVELDVRVVMARELCLGPMARALAVRARGPRPDGITPANLLQEALTEVRRLSATHGEVAHAFDLYRANVADAWEQHALGDVIDARRSETMRAAKEALDHLLAAATHSEAAADSYAVAQGVPYESPLWGRCTSAAENLARLALQDATTAHGAVTRMLDGLVLEFFDTWKLLKAAEKQPWKRLARSVARPLELAARLDGVVQDLRSLHSHLRKLSDQLHVKTSNMAAAGASGSSAASVIADLEAAHREIRRVMALHAAAGHILTVCAPHLDVEGDTVRTWDRHRTDAVCAGRETMRRMGCAVSACMALDTMLSGAQSANCSSTVEKSRATL
ncbi:uncharacterized protein [Lolium perenne]|uniref:uncharacterized protein n=1 Tax=Lolium perenne TaxID=4522 RepID=UPI003A9A5D53